MQGVAKGCNETCRRTWLDVDEPNQMAYCRFGNLARGGEEMTESGIRAW
jgi:hypothetical protein